jgi:hypothetical protein
MERLEQFLSEQRIASAAGTSGGCFLLIIVSSFESGVVKQYPSAYKPFHAGSPTKSPPSGMGQVEISGL